MKDRISIIGAGLVGSLLAIILKQKGFRVQIFEKRKNPKKIKIIEDRSINLALSYRGIRSLKLAGIYNAIVPFLIPMTGRMIHNPSGKNVYQSYGKDTQFINSISRTHFNKLLIESAEKAGVEIYFNHKCTDVDFEENIIHLHNGKNIKSDLIIGADGAFSMLRQKLQLTNHFNFSQHYIKHGYKELSIRPTDGEFSLAPNYLHIWPRGNFMLIALPNNDKTFTSTLFFPFEGSPSFADLIDENKVYSFFDTYFTDAKTLISNLSEQFFMNPTSSLITTKCEPWHKNRCLLIGDAAHTIVPFYGQGMNSGLEDVRLLIEMAENMSWNWDKILPSYSQKRKKDADAISELALMNFIEMRDHVGDADFLKIKKLEAKIQQKYPNEWTPLYSMVTFSDIPYSEALRLGKIQKQVMNETLKSKNEEIVFEKIIDRFNALR